LLTGLPPARVSDKPLEIAEFSTLEQNKGGKKPVIEIRTRVSAANGNPPGRNYRGGPPPPMPQYYPPDDDYEGGRGPAYPEVGYPERGSDSMKVFKADKPEMVIHSPYLRAALSAVVGYYTNYSTTGDGTVIESPYQVLVHHWRALEKYGHNQPECHDAEYAATTAKHIDVLLSFLKETYGESLEAESNRWNNPSGATATFDLFWVLLKPGEVIYREVKGLLVPFVISSVQRTDQVRGQEAYVVDHWDIGFQHGRLRRRMHKATVFGWNGERTITGLSVIPARFVPDGEQAMAEKRRELGKRYWELSKQPCYREYSGQMVDKDGKRLGNMTGRVVVDCEGWERFRHGAQDRYSGYPEPPRDYPRGPHQTVRLDALPQTQPRCSCKACGVSQLPLEPSPFAGFDNLDPNRAEPPENGDLYFHVISSTIPAFILGQRIWGKLLMTALLSFDANF